VLLPRDADHDAQSVILGDIKQPPRRHGVRANRVETVGRNVRKIALDFLDVVVFFAGGVGPERAVSHSAHPKLGIGYVNELTENSRPGALVGQ
jgi:hypothetical protein